MNPALKEFLDSPRDGVFYIGHASALARIDNKLILFDPVWNHKPYGDYWRFEPEQIDCEVILDKIDFCIISHIHEDHVCERIIRKLARNGCKFAIMSGRGNRQNLMERLQRYGCGYRAIEPFKWLLWMGLEFYFVPHTFNTVDSSCFVRNRDTGYTVYHGNDNFLSQEALCRLKNEVGNIDVAMVPYAFIHWYPSCMNMPTEEIASETARLNQQSMDQAQAFLATLRPKISIPFGNNLVHVEEHLNKSLSKPEEFVGAENLHAGCFVLGEEVEMVPTDDTDPLYTIVDKCRRARMTVPNHAIVVSKDGNEFGYVIDLEERTAWYGEPKKGRETTRFDFRPVELHKWLAGEITFEQAIGTRQFRCTRVPNKYNLQVFEWMNTWL